MHECSIKIEQSVFVFGLSQSYTKHYLHQVSKANHTCFYSHYPGGMPQPGRSYNSNSYRYGYQGSEKDDEIAGNGNHITTHFRENDTRLMRWWSVDPVFQPWQSPYATMNGNPIMSNDPRGDFVPIVIGAYYLSASAVAWLTAGTVATAIVVVNREEIADGVIGASGAIMSLGEGFYIGKGEAPNYGEFNGRPTSYNPFPGGVPPNLSKLKKVVTGLVGTAAAAYYFDKPRRDAEQFFTGVDKTDDGGFIVDDTSFNLENANIDVNSEDSNLIDIEVEVSMTYEIRKGDNLTDIAKKYDTTIEALVSGNDNISHRDTIRAGETINVGTRTIQKTISQDDL